MTGAARAREIEDTAKAIWRGIFNGAYAFDGQPTLTDEEWEPVWSRLSERELVMYRSAAAAALAAQAAQTRALREALEATCWLCRDDEYGRWYEREPRAVDTSERREWRHFAKNGDASEPWQKCELSPLARAALPGAPRL